MAKVRKAKNAEKSTSRSKKSTPKKSTPKKPAAETEQSNTENSPPSAYDLTDGEISVLSVFRTYLMTPGQMLCLNNADTDTMRKALQKLVDAGMLMPEEMKGGYSLTRTGFDAMKSISS